MGKLIQPIKEIIKSTMLYRLFSLDENELNEVVKSYVDCVKDTDIVGLRRRMRNAYLLFGIPFRDFYQCRCDELTYAQISQIVPLVEQRKLWRRVNSKESHDILCDKFKSYQLFKIFYKRDVVLLDGLESKDEYAAFSKTHPRFIVKPLGMNCGKGIHFIDTLSNPVTIDNLMESFPNGLIAEELITQAQVLAQFHPTSVNTLRINTVNYGDSVEVKWPCLRIGRGGSIVDNAGAGGVFGAIDPNTGVIIAASDEFHHSFANHPDTDVPIIGFQIPQWQEACVLAEQLARCIPDCHFVGWDFALTDNGWVMVEGNYGPLLIWQIAVGRGIRKEFLQMKKHLFRKQ